jgi:hypothetical protein
MQENLSDITSISIIQMKNNNNHKVNKCMISFFCWICTLIIWALIGMIIYIFIPVKMDSDNFDQQYQLFLKKRKLKSIVITAIIIFYIVYIILEFFSPIVIYLKQYEEENLENLMKNLFGAKPSFIFKYNLDKSMNEEFEFDFCKDISGIFELDITKDEIENKKVYFMLEINYEIKFADNDTIKAYIQKRKEFKDKIKREKGNIKSIKEEIELKKMKNYYKVKTNKKDFCLIDFCLYIIFTILTFSELYKLYINSKIIYGKFLIIKLVSANSISEKFEIFNSFNPGLKIEDTILNYNQDDKKFNNNNQNKNKNQMKKSEKYNNIDTNENSKAESSTTKFQN